MQKQTWWERAGIPEQLAILVTRNLRIYERNLRGPHSVRKKANTAERQNKQKYAAIKRRSKLKQFSKPLPRNLTKQVLLARQTDSLILGALCPDRTSRWKSILMRRSKTSIDVRNFSFLDNPAGVIESLQRIAVAENEFADVAVNFVDDQCLDIGAMLVLEEIWRKLCPVFNGGRISMNFSKVLEALGLRRQFGWKPIGHDSAADVFPFTFRRQERPAEADSSTGIEPRKSQKDATELVRFVDSTLNGVSQVGLTREARQKFQSLVGEILDNAGTHATEDKRGGYTICGFVYRHEIGTEERFRFHLGFLSVGQSIAESLESPPEQIKKDMERYVNRHIGHTWPTWENLTTVYAIRDGITRLREKLSVVDGKSLGGTGLADILDFFSDLCLIADPSKAPVLAIVSGTTYILVKEPYQRALRRSTETVEEINATSPRELWFNQENSPDMPPDKGHVFSLPGRLAGTLVTMAFDVDPNLVEKLENAKSRSRNSHAG